MGQAKQRKAEIEQLKSTTNLVVDLNKVDYENVTDINTFVKSVSGCDDRFLELMKQLTGNDPEIVKPLEFGGKPLQCLENADLLSHFIGGESVKGWQLLLSTNSAYENPLEVKPWDDQSLARSQRRFGFQEINQHMVVRAPDGLLYDSSPSIGASMPTQFRIFWADDKLLTTDALDYEIVDGNVITWGGNHCYLPIAGRGMLRLSSADDLQHIVPGELSPMQANLIRGRVRNIAEHIERNGLVALNRAYA